MDRFLQLNLIHNELKKKYQEFFKEFEINDETGCMNRNPNIKFATYPYIGSKYGYCKKILFVGLDIGADETIGCIQPSEERRLAIEDACPSKHNPHIAGTYITTLCFLKDILDWQTCWDNLKNIYSCQKALSNEQQLPSPNPLSYIALTNYYKFVSINRINRSGGENRKHLEEVNEFNLFIDEVNILNPDIIIFQSIGFNHKKELLDKLLGIGKTVFVGPHPAYRGKREPEHYVNKIQRITNSSQ